MSAIEVKSLHKSFSVYHKEPGVRGSLKALLRRKTEKVLAVKDVSFEIKEGELIGFIGPNGAGKTTTLKCLSGLLYPTSGNVKVLGFTPFDRKKEFLRQISLVMGQKNQLWWDLPATETFLLNKEIYQIPDRQYKETYDELIELLDLSDTMSIQVRKLSLGQRMRCELMAALLHRPKVLFLDEPTIGLDVIAQKKMREFIKNYNQKFKATIILTSHYMGDVQALCERVIVIDHGSLLFDGALDDIVKAHSQSKLLKITFTEEVSMKKLDALGVIREYFPTQVLLSVKRSDVKHVAAKILETFPVDDLNIEESAIEDIIRDFFNTSHESA
jgi:ABC-2 type transport system ATP-binding protein